MIKKVFLSIVLAFVLFKIDAQTQTPISALPTYTGDPSGGWVPVVVGSATRKTDAKNLGAIDSIHVSAGTTYDTLKALKNGVVKYYKLIRAGSLTLTTTGTSGAATLVGSTLNIPQYSGGGSLPASYDSMYRAFYNAFGGDTSIVIMAGTVRNSCGVGSAIKWELVSVTNPADHSSLYLSTDVDSTGDGFRVKFPAGYKCITFLAAPDETLVLRGYQCGSSFSTSYADVRITKLINQSSAIWGNGTANSIDQYGSTIYGGTIYTDATGQFVTTVRNQGYHPNYAVSITSANPLYYPVIDGNASYAQNTVVKWSLYKHIDGTKLTGTLPYGSYAHISAAPYWTTEVCNTTVGSEIGCGGSSNVWIIGLLKKN